MSAVLQVDTEMPLDMCDRFHYISDAVLDLMASWFTDTHSTLSDPGSPSQEARAEHDDRLVRP